MVELLQDATFASAVSLLVLEVVRNRRRGASWWRVILESKTGDQEWPLFLSAWALIFIAAAGTRQPWALILVLPVYGFVAWHLSHHGAPSVSGRDDHLLLEPVQTTDPPSHVKRVEEQGD